MDFFTINSIKTRKQARMSLLELENETFEICPVFYHIGADFRFEVLRQSSDKL